VSTEKSNISIVRHPTSARLKKYESLFCDRHDFSNHANLFVQKLTKFTFSSQRTEKLPFLDLKTRNSGVALKIEAGHFFEKQGFSVKHYLFGTTSSNDGDPHLGNLDVRLRILSRKA